MYNHYIPQSDGSYRRSQQPEQRKPAPPKPKPEPKPEPPKECHPEPEKPAPAPSCPPPQMGIFDFFKNLLPRQIDTADLFIICLLLLMNRDEEDGLSPVLTLALYFLL